jgi:hypothetical protein
VPLVLEFLAAYASHPEARRADTRLLSRYIRKQNENDELTEWCVKLASSSNAEDAATFDSLIDGIVMGANTRTAYPMEQVDERYSIRRLVNPADELADLDETEWDVALAQTRLLWESNPRKNKPAARPDMPSGQGIRYARPKQRGLLLIYPLDPNEGGLSRKLPITGIAISFPQSDTAEPISYTVTNLFTQLGDYDDL